MAAQQLKTFQDIYTAVMEELKLPLADTVSLGRVQRMVNEVYMDLVSKHTWDWTRGYTQITLSPYISLANTHMTQGSDLVTLAAPSALSLQDYEFSMDGSTAVYHVLQHTAGTAALSLATAYGETSQTTATVKVWQQRLALPPDCLQVIQVVSPYMETPFDLTTLLDFRRYTAAIPKLWGRPQIGAVQGETESAYYALPSGLPAAVGRASARFEKSLMFSGDVTGQLSVGQRIRVTTAQQYSYNCDSVVASIGTQSQTFVASGVSTSSYALPLAFGSSSTGIYIGMSATGTGLQANTVVTAVSPTVVTISPQPASNHSNVTITVSDQTNGRITYVAKANYDEAAVSDTSSALQVMQQRPSEQEYRELLVHPAISTERIVLSIDYKRRAIALNGATDEPWMPLEDRIVLKHGVLGMAWATLMRNPEAAAAEMMAYEKKWVAMKGKLTNMTDLPRLVVNQTYLEAKRRRSSRYRWRRF